MMKTLVYLAHPVRDYSKLDLVSSLTTWLGQLIPRFPDHAFQAPWLLYVLALDDGNQTHRERGLEDDIEWLLRCDQVWLLGDVVSDGMALEAEHARINAMPVLRVLRRGAQLVVSEVRTRDGRDA